MDPAGVAPAPLIQEVTVKKLLLLALAAGTAVFVKRKLDESRTEQALWAEATDNVERS